MAEQVSPLSWYRVEGPDSIIITVKVMPKSRKREIIVDSTFLRVKITEPAVEGAANKGLKKYLSTFFDVSQTHITILQGEHRRLKTVRLDGIDDHSFLDRLSRLTTAGREAMNET